MLISLMDARQQGNKQLGLSCRVDEVIRHQRNVKVQVVASGTKRLFFILVVAFAEQQWKLSKK